MCHVDRLSCHKWVQFFERLDTNKSCSEIWSIAKCFCKAPQHLDLFRTACWRRNILELVAADQFCALVSTNRITVYRHLQILFCLAVRPTIRTLFKVHKLKTVLRPRSRTSSPGRNGVIVTPLWTIMAKRPRKCFLNISTVLRRLLWSPATLKHRELGLSFFRRTQFLSSNGIIQLHIQGHFAYDAISSPMAYGASQDFPSL